MIPFGRNRSDVFLWEHAVRVTSTALRIAHLPELASQQVDLDVLQAAALYHDSGWVVQFREGQITREDVLAKLPTPVQRELAASLFEESLTELLPAETLAGASACIRMLNDHDVDVAEAWIIVEADNLEECGPLSLLRLWRRHTFEGKGLQAIVERWQTQRRYGYWDARINDTIRLDAVKKIARQRLKALDRVVEELRRHDIADDIAPAFDDNTEIQA